MLLPRGKPVREPFNPAKMNWVEAFGKLSEGRFSGYLHCRGAAGNGLVLFVGGQLAAVRFYSGTTELPDAEALVRIFSCSLAGELTLSIFRLSRGLALQVYGVLAGELLYGGQQLHLLDIPHVLDKLKGDRFNGCLRVAAAEDLALIFYREGRPLGFFHDGTTELSRTADLAASVARFPEATLDIVAGRQDVEADLPDLMQSHDIGVLWKQAVKQAEAAG